MSSEYVQNTLSARFAIQAAKSIFVDHVKRVSCWGKNIIKGHIKINQLATIAYCAVVPVTTKADHFLSQHMVGMICLLIFCMEKIS